MKKVQEEVVSYEENMPRRVVKTTTVGDESSEANQEFKKKKTIFRVYQIIWYILGVLEAFLFFRLFLKLIGANSGSPFTVFIYNTSFPLVSPFFAVKASLVAPQGSVFEWGTILAMIVYAVVAYGIIYLIQLIKPADPGEVEEAVDV